MLDRDTVQAERRRPGTRHAVQHLPIRFFLSWGGTLWANSVQPKPLVDASNPDTLLPRFIVALPFYKTGESKIAEYRTLPKESCETSHSL